jgi:hypothetical protein
MDGGHWPRLGPVDDEESKQLPEDEKDRTDARHPVCPSPEADEEAHDPGNGAEEDVLGGFLSSL